MNFLRVELVGVFRFSGSVGDWWSLHQITDSNELVHSLAVCLSLHGSQSSSFLELK